MRPIEIFRQGTHTDAHGRVVTFSEADLEETARVYDPAVHEAPLVIGHPRTDAPAYGWVERLEARQGRLYAQPRQVAPEFAELVRAGRYKKVSAAFYGPAHPQNPAPGHWYLRHVGFLGAQPPAVKGLRGVEFGDDGSDLVVVELELAEAGRPMKTEDGQRYPAEAYAYVPDPQRPSTWKLRLWEDPQKKETAAQVARAIQAVSPAGFRGRRAQIPQEDLPAVLRRLRAAWRRTHPGADPEQMPAVLRQGAAYAEPAGTVARVLRRLREWLIGREGLETADRVIPAHEVEALREVGQEPEPETAGPAPAFAEEDEAMITKEQHEQALRRAREEAARQAEARFAEQAEALKAREQELARREAELKRAEVAAFVEDLVDAGKVLPADREALVGFLAGDETVSFAEGDQTRSVPRHEWFRRWLERLPRLVDYAERGAGEDPPEADPVAIAQKAQQYVEAQRAKGVEVSYAEAVAHVTGDE